MNERLLAMHRPGGLAQPDATLISEDTMPNHSEDSLDMVAQPAKWISLKDSNWVNIVNSPAVLSHGRDAVAAAVSLTEAKLKELNAHNIAQPVQPASEAKRLWLWKNFVGGKPEYWAFENTFPVHMNGGDPQTLGEPCGYALLKPSRQGCTDVSDEQVLKRIANIAQPVQPDNTSKLYEELRSIIDSGSESFTHADAVRYLIDNLAQPEQGSKPKCFADFQPNHAAERECQRCAVETECKTGVTQPEPVELVTVYEAIVHWDEGGGKRSRRELARRIVEIYASPPKRQPDDFDSWYASPYTKVLMKSIDEDYSPKRQPLTDEQLWQLTNDCIIGGDVHVIRFARAIEAAHGIGDKT